MNQVSQIHTESVSDTRMERSGMRLLLITPMHVTVDESTTHRRSSAHLFRESASDICTPVLSSIHIDEIIQIDDFNHSE